MNYIALYNRIIALAITLAAFANIAQGQYFSAENNVWAFGDSAGVNFNSGVPMPFNANMLAYEGCASVCNTAGELLFYTEGRTVWDRTHHIMPSGNAIVPYYTISAAQSTAIVQQLGETTNKFYIFSIQHYGLGSGGEGRLSYSVVNMALNGGLGDVETANIPMNGRLAEKIIVVPGNNCNYWVLVHARDSARFYSYEITSAGVNMTPVVSAVGDVEDCFAAGVMKISPDRTKLAYVNFGVYSPTSPSRAELFDFDPNTGIVSNYKLLCTADRVYGAEFSPDNSKLYIVSTLGTIFQYQVSLPTISEIIASEDTVYTCAPGIGPGDIRTGPDGKIYMKSTTPGYLARFNTPNLAGAACGFEDSVVVLSPGGAMWGFPNLFWKRVVPAIVGSTSVCKGQTIAFSHPTPAGGWSSSNLSVAYIDAGTGIVTGAAPGTATISYSTHCGTATATVTVVPSPATVTGVTHLPIGGTTTLSTTSTGGTWASSNTVVATVDAVTGIVTGVSFGTSIISYIFPTGCFATDTVYVDVANAVNAVQNGGTLLLYPQPASEKLIIELPGYCEAADVTVYDVLGCEVHHKKHLFVSTRATIDVSGLSNGQYLLKLQTDNGIYRVEIAVLR